MGKSRKRKMMKAAAKAPTWLRSIAAIKRRGKDANLGKFGPASPVRNIDVPDNPST